MRRDKGKEYSLFRRGFVKERARRLEKLATDALKAEEEKLLAQPQTQPQSQQLLDSGQIKIADIKAKAMVSKKKEE